MTQTEVDTAQDDYDHGPGPGAPIPISQLSVRVAHWSLLVERVLICQGVAGLTDRDIKLVTDGGYHTVEAIAYT